MIRGIDVFSGSGTVDFQTAKDAGLQFCIARCGFGEDISSQDDGQFQRNYDQCKALGIPLGSYFYTYAMTVSETESEKAHLKRLLAGKSFELPVFVDMEDADRYKARHGGIPDAQTNTRIIRSLGEFIKSLGFTPGFYCNKDWAENHLIMGQLSDYAFYYARPGVAQPDKPCYLWQDQIGSTGGHFPGVKSDAVQECDTDILMADLLTKALQPVAPASSAGTAHHIGENVVFSTCYVSSTDPTSKAIAASDMTRNHGIITSIAPDAHNPYLLDGGLCWVNDGDIRGPYSAATPSAPSPVTSVQTYTVQSGDTLSGIAAKYGTSYQAIAALNGIADPNKIYPGQVLRLAGSASSAPAAPAAVTYTVRPGDTLSEIAAKYDTTYQHLAEINGISKPNLIRVGQVLKIK